MTVFYNFFIKKSQVVKITLFLFIWVNGTAWASTFFQEIQEQAIVEFDQYKGKVIDTRTKRSLVFANFTIEGTNISTVTNGEGEFLLKVPKHIKKGDVQVSFLGYKMKIIPLTELKEKKNKITLDLLVTKLKEVEVVELKNAKSLVKEMLRKKSENYFDDPTLMVAFYRESIKKRRRNVSLSEAVVNIYKTPYTSSRRDAIELYKVRKSTDYSRLDTLAIKLQGGPFNTLFLDVMKYPEYIFNEETIDCYQFSFDRSTRINEKLIYVIDFKQDKSINESLYKGKLFIDAERKILTSAIYSLNIKDKKKAARLFLRKKPPHSKVWPVTVAYRVDYREKNGKWYYGYSNALLKFKVDWDKKLFNSTYTMSCEMVVTDWVKNTEKKRLSYQDRIKSTIIIADEAIGFSDPDFWGEYNIIEPEKSIETAIRKIKKELKTSKL